MSIINIDEKENKLNNSIVPHKNAVFYDELKELWIFPTSKLAQKSHGQTYLLTLESGAKVRFQALPQKLGHTGIWIEQLEDGSEDPSNLWIELPFTFTAYEVFINGKTIYRIIQDDPAYYAVN